MVQEFFHQARLVSVQLMSPVHWESGMVVLASPVSDQQVQSCTQMVQPMPSAVSVKLVKYWYPMPQVLRHGRMHPVSVLTIGSELTVCSPQSISPMTWPLVAQLPVLQNSRSLVSPVTRLHQVP